MKIISIILLILVSSCTPSNNIEEMRKVTLEKVCIEGHVYYKENTCNSYSPMLKDTGEPVPCK